MTTYIIAVSVTPRKTPSMYETNTQAPLQVGYTFDVSVIQNLDPNPPIAGQVGAIQWLQLPNSYWIPSVYKGVTYAKLASTPTSPPPTPSTPTLSHVVKVYSDGSLEVYAADGTTLQYKG